MVLNVAAIDAPHGLLLLAETPSTMDAAAAQAREGAPHLFTVVAERQTAGRGRRGRAWQDVAGANIAMTVVLRDGLGPQLALVSSVAVWQALQRFAPDVRVKWPNDILLQTGKVAGLLIEQGPDWALLGIGINVKKAATAQEIPRIALEEGATKEVAREEVISAVLAELAEMLGLYAEKGWAAVAPAYEKVCCTLGQQVIWQQGDQEISGIAIGLTQDGALELKTADGKVHTVFAGDIMAQGRKYSV